MVGTAKEEMYRGQNAVKVVLTGGGSAGHVIPNIALIPELQKAGCSVSYIASHQGVESDLLQPTGIPIFRISTGKLRRYFSPQNIGDVFRACAGLPDAFAVLGKLKPHVVFSKGGFVSLPVVIAAWMRRIPIIIHESDVSLGLANRISTRFAHTICVTHEETKSQIRNSKNVVVTGLPLRRQIFCGDKKKGLELCGFDSEKPVLLVIGGGLGSRRLNETTEQSLSELLGKFQIAHITGKGKSLPHNLPGYHQFEFISEIEHLYACADIIISRAGATSVAEIVALKKRNILIPLPAVASRGDQLETASLYERQGLSSVIREEELSPRRLAEVIEQMESNSERHLHPHTFTPQSSAAQIVRVILNGARGLNG